LSHADQSWRGGTFVRDRKDTDQLGHGDLLNAAKVLERAEEQQQ
jgi:hypothetical protein